MPLESSSIGELPRTGHRAALQTPLEWGQIVHRYHPAQPAAAQRLASAHDLAVDRLVRGRMIEYLDSLEIAAVCQRQDVVAGAEAGVEAPVLELASQDLAQLIYGCLQSLRASHECQMVDMHAAIVATRLGICESGVGAAQLMDWPSTVDSWNLLTIRSRLGERCPTMAPRRPPWA